LLGRLTRIELSVSNGGRYGYGISVKCQTSIPAPP
jgi:hypothetical protein